MASNRPAITIQNALYLTVEEVARLLSQTKEEILEMSIFQDIPFHKIPRNDILGINDIVIKRTDLAEKLSHKPIMQKYSANLVDKQILNTDQAAELLNLKKRTIYNKIQKGEIPHRKKGRKLYFYKKELLNWIATGERI